MYKHQKSKFLILIPAYNELKNLKRFIKEVNKLAPMYVLDDCSTDNTEQWLLNNQIKFVRNKKNVGYEKNLINGMKKFKNNSEFLITFDGDGQHQISDLKTILKKKENYDIIVCNRKNKNRFLEVIISKLSELLYGIKDPLSGFKVYKTKILKEDNFKKIGNYFLLDFLINFTIKKFRIINYPITTKKRIGKPKVGGITKVTLKEVNIIFKLILTKLNC